jgi:mannose-6-phosphate isomerase
VTPHSFGPDTLGYEIEQTSDIQQHAERWHMADGSPVDDGEFAGNLDMLVQEVRADRRPDFTTGLSVRVDDGVEQTFLCAGPYFALERWHAGTAAPIRRRFQTAQVLSNVGAPVTVTAGDWSGDLDAAETLLLPACVGEVEIAGPADVLFGYLPDLDRDVRRPLAEAGYGPQVVAVLGEGLG